MYLQVCLIPYYWLPYPLGFKIIVAGFGVRQYPILEPQDVGWRYLYLLLSTSFMSATGWATQPTVNCESLKCNNQSHWCITHHYVPLLCIVLAP